MSWFDGIVRFFSRAPSTGAAQRDASSADLGNIVSAEQAMGVSALYACVRLISSTNAGLPFGVYRTAVDGSRESVSDHDLYRLLHDSPNADQTAFEFWELMNHALELRGNAYARISRISSRITALTPIHPDSVSLRRLSSGAVEYAWSEDGKRYVCSDTEMFHLRGFTGGGLAGISTLQVGARTIAAARYAHDAAESFFANGIRTSGILKFKEWLSADKRDAVEAALVRKYVGAVNSGRPMVLEGGSDYMPLTMNPEDAQLLDSRKFSIEEICRLFGVPPFMIGHTQPTTSWGTGLEQQLIAFKNFTLNPRIERIEQRISKQLLSPDDRGAGVYAEFNFDGLMRGDTLTRMQSYQVGLTNGIYTINEVRRLENMPPVIGGDVPRMQMQNVPITEHVAARPVA